MFAITNEDVLDEFLKFCKNADKKSVLKEWGGSSIYIPTFSGEQRDNEIKRHYKNELKNGNNKSLAIRNTAKEFNLSTSRVYRILRGE